MKGARILLFVAVLGMVPGLAFGLPARSWGKLAPRFERLLNTDQGSQFTSFDFTKALSDRDIRILMDGKGRWMDNVFIERLWRSLKYECVYLYNPETGSEARERIGTWFDQYNNRRPHSSFGDSTPMEVHRQRLAA